MSKGHSLTEVLNRRAGGKLLRFSQAWHKLDKNQKLKLKIGNAYIKDSDVGFAFGRQYVFSISHNLLHSKIVCLEESQK